MTRPFFSQRPALGTTSYRTVVIVHSLAVTVEQLCARSPDAPAIARLRPKSCVCCGEPARNAQGVLQLVGHGMYCRQVRGLSEAGWFIIWVRRFLCRVCGHTVSLLPDWLHPWRWYAATVIVEALYRHCVISESARVIGVRFGRSADTSTWHSLLRWRRQQLVSMTLWGWLGPRLGIRKPAIAKPQAAAYVHRLLAEGGLQVRSTVDLVKQLPAAVRKTLRDLVHGRKSAGSLGQFLPGRSSGSPQERPRQSFPTEKGSGSDPP